MEWLETASYIANGVLGLLVALAIIVIKGMLASNSATFDDYKRHSLTGVEREDMRRRLLAQGLNGVHPHEVMDLIYTFRSIELGQYKDEDPYIPQEDPYEDIDENIYPQDS
jgi:hypothetical protein